MPNHVCGIVSGVDNHARQDLGPDWVQVELERGNDAKFAPAPHMPQNSSGSSSREMRIGSPSAVTADKATRLSTVTPARRINQPTPPPSVSPATPVSETVPPVTREAMQLSLAIDETPRSAALNQSAPAVGINDHAVHRLEVDHDTCRQARSCPLRRARRCAR